MKSIYTTRKEFKQSMAVWDDIQKSIKKNEYTNYIIVIAKEDPDDEGKLLFDSHYNVNNTTIVDAAKNLIEEIEEAIDEE